MCLSMSIFVTFGLRLALVGGRVYRWGLQGAAGLALLVVSAGLASARIEMWIFQKLAQRFFAMRYRDIISAFVVPLVASHWEIFKSKYAPGAHAVPRSWRGEGRWDKAH